MTERFIYLDHSATTPVRKEVLETMFRISMKNTGILLPYIHLAGKVKKRLRMQGTKLQPPLGAQSREIFFTGSGTEADNWAIKGIAYANKVRVIISSLLQLNTMQ